MNKTLPLTNRSLLLWWHDTPLFLRIGAALVIGILLGILLGPNAVFLGIPSKIILQLLGALAPPLILFAVVHVLMTSDIPGRSAGRLAMLLLLNTTVAILIGLVVTNIIQPGKWSELATPTQAAKETQQSNPWSMLLGNIPRSLLGPFGDQQNAIGVIIIAVAFGVALRHQKDMTLSKPSDIVEVVFQALITILHWIIDLVPIGVLGIVASVVGEKGFEPFKALGAFILTVILALLLQTIWYLLRIRYFSWVRPWQVLVGMRDALFMAFSTGSSTATMPVTYACLIEKVGLRERSASLGGLVGANFNNDGTALYEATAALFIAQLIGHDLSLLDQAIIVLTSIIASVGAAGIPEAGLVTMTLVLTAVRLPTEYITLIFAVDWFLDRCRTVVNVLGDVNISCILDGYEPERPSKNELPIPGPSSVEKRLLESLPQPLEPNQGESS